MGQVNKLCNVCDICSHDWIPTPGVVYTHCTSSKCRSRKWDHIRRDAIEAEIRDRVASAAEVFEPSTPESTVTYERDIYSQD